MAFSSVTIIYNPNSTGPSQPMAEALATKLESYPAPVSLQGSERPGHAEELAEAAARQGTHPLVISSSGDGGYHEVVNGVMKANLAGNTAAAAVLPGGNGNDHRRAIARGTLAGGVLSNRTAHIDLLNVIITPPNGPARTRYAHAYAGLGLTPLIAAELNRHKLNPARELIIFLQALSKLQPVTIKAQNQLQHLDSLILANIKETGKTLTLTDTGGPADGQFEVVAYPADTKLRLLGRLIKATLAGLKPDRRASRYEFETTEPTLIQLDGEVTQLSPGTQVSVTSMPRILETVL